MTSNKIYKDNYNKISNDNYNKISNMKDKFVVLSIYLSDLSNSEIIQKYRTAVEKQQNAVIKYIDRYFVSEYDSSINYDLESGVSQNICLDAGFDLFVPNYITFYSNETHKIDMGIRCSMTYNNIPCSYYMYPRSSTGLKTPLRMSNNVGIIDSGYRGNLIAVFDNINNNSIWNVEMGDRLVQICSGNLLYPIFPVIVNNVEQLGTTHRGIHGFGSTGQ